MAILAWSYLSRVTRVMIFAMYLFAFSYFTMNETNFSILQEQHFAYSRELQ